MTLTTKFDKAVSDARQLYAGRVRKDGSGAPYVMHLLAVAALVLEFGGGEVEAIAALKHDDLEDTDIGLDNLRHRAGDEVAGIVLGCTEDKSLRDWRERKEDYLERLHNASPAVKLVAAADKLHNLRSLAANLRREGEAVWRHFDGGKPGTLWFYVACREVLGDGWDNAILAAIDEELARLPVAVEEAIDG